MRRRAQQHPFADRWNHNTHYFPAIRARIPERTTWVLDVGCGDGTLCRYLGVDGRRVVGVDIDTRVLPTRSATALYAVTSAEALAFADGSVEAVTMCMVLHHVDASRALAEAARVLAPGGVLLVLGYARYGGWRDLPAECRDVLAHRFWSRRTQPWEPPTTKADPRGTWAETRSLLERALPGCRYRRLPLWRYLVEWTKPAPVGV